MSANVRLRCIGLETPEPDECVHMSVEWQHLDSDPVDRWGIAVDLDGRKRGQSEDSPYERDWEATFYLSVAEARILAAYLTFALAHEAAGA